jgi:hypothetical protein
MGTLSQTHIPKTYTKQRLAEMPDPQHLATTTRLIERKSGTPISSWSHFVKKFLQRPCKRQAQQ